MTKALAFHGIDIGGSKIELVGFEDEHGRLVERHRRRVATPRCDFDEFIAAVAGLVEEADAAMGQRALNGRLVREAIGERLRRPVFIGNDCQCFALSEAQGGGAAGLPSMFGAILGTGAGGGFCVDGALVAGYNGSAGEWGHWSLPATLASKYSLPLLPCPCGRTGCLERYVSGSGMSFLHRHLFGGEREAIEIAARAAAGNAPALRTLEIHLDLLAHAMAALIIAYDPHAIVLGGGLSSLPHLYQQLPAAISRHLFHGLRLVPVLAPYFGAAGGARGAALFARLRYL